MYAAPPMRTVDASSLPIATVCSPECSDESCTTFPVVEPETNCTVIRAEPSSVAAVNECLSAWRSDPDDPAADDAAASDVTARLSSRQPTNVSPRQKAVLAVSAAAGELMADAP